MSMVTECPWCASVKLTWTIPAYSSQLYPECDDCGARAAGVSVKLSDKIDRDKLNAIALKQWNSRA